MSLFNQLAVIFVPAFCMWFSRAQLAEGTVEGMCPEEELCQSLQRQCPLLRSFRGRPALFNPNDTKLRAIAHLRLDLIRLVELSDIDKRMSINAQLTMMWWLPFCALWNASALSPIAYQLESCEFDNDQKKDIWRPNLMFLNDLDSAESIQESSGAITVYNGSDKILSPTGNPYAILKSRGRFNTICNFDFRAYPFDWQNCSLDLHTDPDPSEINWIDLQVVVGNLSEFADIGAFTGGSDKWEYLFCGTFRLSKQQPDLKIWLVFQRKYRYYILSTFAPIILLVSLQFPAFLIPPKIADRFMYAATVLLAISVLQPVVTADIPKTSAPVYLFWYIQINFGLSALMTVYSLFACAWSRGSNSDVVLFSYKMSIYRLADIMVSVICLAAFVILHIVFFDNYFESKIPLWPPKPPDAPLHCNYGFNGTDNE